LHRIIKRLEDIPPKDELLLCLRVNYGVEVYTFVWNAFRSSGGGGRKNRDGRRFLLTEWDVWMCC
jgi:hypothetical protein